MHPVLKYLNHKNPQRNLEVNALLFRIIQFRLKMEKGKKKRKKNEIVRNLIQVDWFKFFMKKRKMPGRSEIIIRTHVVEITLEFKTSPERNILLTPGNSDSNFTRRRNRPPPIHRCIAVSVPGGGYSWKFLVGVCCPVHQILTRFQINKCNFPHPFSD